MQLVSPPPQLLRDYPVVISLPIQWGDQDAFGHINNVVYFRWYESARVAYLDRSGLDHLFTNYGLGPILASIQCDYRKQLNFPDTVYIGAKVIHLGRTSLRMRHAIYSEHLQALAAEGESAVVVFNYQEQQPTPIPPDVRAQIEALEGQPLGPPPKTEN